MTEPSRSPVIPWIVMHETPAGRVQWDANATVEGPDEERSSSLPDGAHRCVRCRLVVFRHVNL
jgi:hypothetical protein